MQLPPEVQEFIRRAFHLEGKAIREIERETGHSRQAIRRAISNTSPALKCAPPSPFRSAPIFGPFQARVEALLAQNDALPRKQQYTSHRIFEIIRAEGYQGCESRIRQHIAACKQAHQSLELFLPLEFEPGQDAQVDWGEAVAIIGGQRQKVQFFVMHLCYSHRTYAACFPSQNQESFLWAHVQAFQHFGGVPHRISYDNLATAVKLAFDKTRKRGYSRQETRAFTSFRSYYLFESHFCTPAQGHEKGGVEGSIGYTRRNFLVPLPIAASFEDLNQQVLARCLQEDARTVARETETIGEAWEKERSQLLPLPPSDYECCEMVIVRLTPYSQAQYETNRYSVPVKHARRTVTVKAYPFTIEIFDEAQKLTSHARCYERQQDVFDPLHYLPLLEQRPGAFEYAKPVKRWQKDWPPAYHQMFNQLKENWPDGRGIQEFIRILILHERYPVSQMQQAIERALSYGCVHLDGVLYCLHEIAGESEPVEIAPLDLSDRPELDAVGNQPVDLSRYEQLLKFSW
jgi:transposase